MGWAAASGYWSTTSDLLKFGEYLHGKCQDPSFLSLIEKYGDEFYDKDERKIMHPGQTSYASAFFFYDPTTDKTGALCSTQPEVVSLGLEFALGNRGFSGVYLDQASQASGSPETNQGSTASGLSQPTPIKNDESSVNSKDNRFNPSPFKMLPKPSDKV